MFISVSLHWLGGGIEMFKISVSALARAFKYLKSESLPGWFIVMITGQDVTYTQTPPFIMLDILTGVCPPVHAVGRGDDH